MPKSEILRYFLNGILAASIHFLVLSVGLEIFRFQSAGVANFIAAIFGSTSSFIGARYYVFCKNEQNILRQALSFGMLYLAIALLHGFVMYIWSDLAGLDYRIGFVVATTIQVVLAYFGNKTFVFMDKC